MFLAPVETIDSTGDGKTPETALCVIDVHQEYEYIQRVVRLSVLQLVRQSVADGIDCLELKDYDGHIEKVISISAVVLKWGTSYFRY